MHHEDLSVDVGARLSRACRHKQRRQFMKADTMPNTQPGSAYFLEERSDKPETHTLSILVDNEPGVLARIAGLFSGRGYNIESLTVSETEHAKHLSRFTVVTTGTPMVLEQIKSQLERLVNVHRVVDLTVAGRAVGARAGADQSHRQGRQAHRGVAHGRNLPRQRHRCLHRAFRVRDHGAHVQDRAVHLHHDGARPAGGVAHRHRRHRAWRQGHVAACKRACAMTSAGFQSFGVTGDRPRRLEWPIVQGAAELSAAVVARELMRQYRIAAIPGDGIGGEVIAAGVEALVGLRQARCRLCARV